MEKTTGTCIYIYNLSMYGLHRTFLWTGAFCRIVENMTGMILECSKWHLYHRLDDFMFLAPNLTLFDVRIGGLEAGHCLKELQSESVQSMRQLFSVHTNRENDQAIFRWLKEMICIFTSISPMKLMKIK